MPNFILIHGAWQGAWAWDHVVKQMKATGESHEVGEVLALDLPGHGQRSVDEIRRITMEHYINAVVTPIQLKRLEEVVLVGQGFAATFLPQVALELGSRVSRVVFIAGDLPPEGEMAYDRLSLRDKLMLRVFKARENGFRFPDFIFKRILCEGLDGSSTREVLSRLVPDPILPWQTPVSRKGFVGSFPTTYVALTRDKVVPYRLQRRYSQSLGSPKVEQLNAGHGAPLTHSQGVSRILLRQS